MDNVVFYKVGFIGTDNLLMFQNGFSTIQNSFERIFVNAENERLTKLYTESLRKLTNKV